jgi:hypothetical protein
LILKENLALARWNDARNCVQKRCLSGTVAADYRDDFPGFHVKRSASYHGEIPITGN